MKKETLHLTLNIALYIIVPVALIASHVLLLAMPDILEWVAGYIGGITTYGAFILIIGGLIYWGLTRK